MGKPTDPDYWKKYRAAHHDRIRAQERARAARPENRRARQAMESARRKRRRAEARVAPPAPLEPLFPKLVHGKHVSFWDDELRMDLEQEGALAALEGRDPDAARRLYADAEWQWWHHTAPIPETA